jgi:hypothetical protein
LPGEPPAGRPICCVRLDAPESDAVGALADYRKAVSVIDITALRALARIESLLCLDVVDAELARALKLRD